MRYCELVDTARWGVDCSYGGIVPDEVQYAHVGVGVLDHKNLVDHVYKGTDVVGADPEHYLALGDGAWLVDCDWVSTGGCSLFHILNTQGPGEIGIVPWVEED